MVWRWEGDLFGRGCLFRWVVSRPTASLTPILLISSLDWKQWAEWAASQLTCEPEPFGARG